MATVSSVRDAIPDVGSNIELDIDVRQAFPSGSKVIDSVIPYGTAAWTRAARVTVALEDGSEKSYFLKWASEDHGSQMIEGEFASISEIAKYCPSLTPVPYAKGKFRESSVPTFYFLMEFLDIATGAPDPATPDLAPFCEQLANLHVSSVSLTGQFGFPITTCHGPHPQNVTWESSWSVFFARLISQFFDREINTNWPSHNANYSEEFDKLVTVTIPRMLEPLQSQGRFLKPSLVHGDLWEENCGKELQTGQPKIFDAASFYAHNEYELGMWRREIIRFGRAHVEQYLRYMPPSEPQEQWDDRNRLYSIKFEIAHSTGWPASCESSRKI